MNAMTGNYPPAAMRASDADRDAVVSDLSEHFQVGRLTAGEFDERTGRALAARTWGELRELLADLIDCDDKLYALAETRFEELKSRMGVWGSVRETLPLSQATG